MSVVLTWTPTADELEVIDASWPDVLPRHLLADVRQRTALLGEVRAMVGYMRSIPKDLLADARALELVHVLGHGVDGLLTPAVTSVLAERKIQVARSNPCGITIAEFTIANMISLSRRVLPLHHALTQRGDWSTDLWLRRGDGVLGGELHGSTLGLVGYGNIAREIHTRAAAFGMEVGAVSRHPDSLSLADLDFVLPWDELDAFLGRCRYVVLGLPLTPATTHLIDADRISAMQDGAYLVNISRGLLVDEDALYGGLASGKLAGAAIDVFEVEETEGRHGYPTRRPLHHFNTILTPHYAGATAESRTRALRTVGDNLRRLLAGQPLSNLAELDRGY